MPRVAQSKLAKASKVLEQCFEGENVDQLLANLNEKERALLDQMVTEIRESGASAQLQQLWRYDYVRQPPTIQEFIDDPYWLGSVTQPTDDNPGLWPTWRAQLTKDFDLDSRIHNVVITGSLGIGKTWVSVLIILYRVVIASLLRNPHNFVGLAVGSKIIYILMSVTRAQVQDTAFGEALNMMSRSPYFLEELRLDPNSRYAGQVVNLGRGLQLNAGSKSQHILGRNTLGIMMDEGNFRLEANPNVKAYKLYHEVRTRIKNRFQKVPGFLPAVSIIASSSQDESSFTEAVIQEIRQKNNPQTEIIYSFPVYHMKNRAVWLRLGASSDYASQHANQYGDKWFKIAYGLRNVAPAVLRGRYNQNGEPIDAEIEPHEAPPQGSRTELAPIDYLEEYNRDPVGALQSLSGVSVGGSHRLFQNLVDLEWCITEGERLGLVNPCALDAIPISQEDDLEIWDYLNHPSFLTKKQGVVQPKRHPSALRFCHLDLATRSMAGLSICHHVGWKEIENVVDRKTGEVFAEQRLLVEYDFILTIIAGKSKPISFEKIQNFIIWLRNKCNYQFALVTSDTFQSFMQLQMLETRGFKTATLSLDRSKAPYYAWRSGIEERRVFLFRQNWLTAEAEKLIDHPKMVDHPTQGEGAVCSKDTADSAAGAYFSCISTPAENLEALETPGFYQEEPQAEVTKPPISIELPPWHRKMRRYVS